MNWWITQVPKTQRCFRKRLQVISWGNCKLPGMGRGTQDGASAGEGKIELVQVGLPVCPYLSPALGRTTAEPWHNNPGTVLSTQLLPCAPERAWASNSRANPTPAGQVLYSDVSQEGGRKTREEKARKKRKGAIKIIFAYLPVVLQSLIFTNEEKHSQHLSKYLNLPRFLCALKKK